MAAPGGTAAIGDWYFTGDYPTPGGYRVLRRSLENHLASPLRFPPIQKL